MKTEEEEDAYAYLSEYAATSQKNDSSVLNINSDEIVSRFRTEGIYVLSSNIEQLSGFSDKFQIKEARTSVGDIFSATYNATTNSLYDIDFN